MNFRAIFLKYLEENNISQIEAGEAMGTSQQAISKFLTNSAPPRPTTKQKIFQSFPDFEDYIEDYLKSKETKKETVIINGVTNEDLSREIRENSEQIKGILNMLNKGVVLLSYNMDEHRDEMRECLELLKKKV